jgi:hypothetical protein
MNPEFSFVLTVGLLLPVYMKPYDLVLLLLPALSRPGWKLVGALVMASYALLAYAAWSGRGGDIFIWLTVIALAYLIFKDRALMSKRLRKRGGVLLHWAKSL